MTKSNCLNIMASKAEEHNQMKNLKVFIKAWEKEFLKLHGKKPDKEDIRNADPSIKESYRTYWKLKSCTEEIQDNVWSESLNKCHQKQNKFTVTTIQTFCDKIKRKSFMKHAKNDMECLKFDKSSQSYPTFKNLSINNLNDSFSLHINNASEVSSCDSKNESSIKIDNKVSEFENESSMKIGNEESECENESVNKYNDETCESMDNNHIFKDLEETEKDILFDPTDTFIESQHSIKIIQNFGSNCKSFNANICSPYNKDTTGKALRFNQDIDKNWFKRCSENIFKESTASSNSAQISNDAKNSLNSTAITTDNQIYESSNSPPTKKAFSHPEESNHEFAETNNVETSAVESDTETKNFEEDIKTIPFINNQELPLDLPNKNISATLEETCDKLYLKTPDNILNKSTSEEKTKTKKRKLANNIELIHSSVSSHKANHLKRKITSGTLNENFLALNIKKKKFSRGYRSVNVKKLKWQKWKQLKASSGQNSPNTSDSTCFKCGKLGHWARQCNVSTKIENAPLEDEEVLDTPLPTLEEAAKLAQEAKNSNSKSGKNCKQSTKLALENVDVEEIFDSDKLFESIDCQDIEEPQKNLTKPLYSTDDCGNLLSTPKAVFEALKELGYKTFRNGQETAVMRVLSGLSTLVRLPTGSGKSLCYQLPAYMYAKVFKSIAIVVSPLVSLMEDQVTGLPSCLHAVCLHSGMTETQKSKAVADITEGKAQIVLVSPEAVIGGRGFSDIISKPEMPSISFACIDEVHCVSQWSHNFRPSYLQLYKVLTQKMGVNCILGLTATATKSTVADIVSHLNLSDMKDSVVGNSTIPRNLVLSVSRDKDKDRALIQLLNGSRFQSCSSIIIYCIRRNETERLATLIRTCMQDEIKPDEDRGASKKKTKSKKRNFAWTAEAYHAGLPPPRRRSIQKKFMTGKLRVVVATVAFGMGLDKTDVRAVIHYNMPKNFESYVQEIGRAGRDGLESHCHVFLSNDGTDISELQRHIYSNSTDRHVLRKLLRRLFVSCKCSSIENMPLDLKESSVENTSSLKSTCPKHEVAFPINETIQALDLKEENISTLLCYLELHPKKWIEILSPAYSTCTVKCYGGSKQMHATALKSPIIAAAIAMFEKNGEKFDTRSQLTFPVVEVASTIGWNSGEVKRHLKNLEWNDMKRKTGVMVEFSDLAFHVLAPGNLPDEELDEVLDFLHHKVTATEEVELKSLKLLYCVFHRYSFSHYWECCDEGYKYQDDIKLAVDKYFSDMHDLENDLKENEFLNKLENDEVDLSNVRSCIRDFIGTHHEHSFNGRAIARIFHGIGSPCFPPEIWGKVWKFWRCLLQVNFNTILKMANEEIRNCK